MTSRPSWFDRALEAAVDCHEIDVDGVPITYRVWGDAARVTGNLLLIHGGAAHSHWWDHIAPFLSGDRRVVALDLSGHGDSGHRPAYFLELWTDEVLAVIDAAGIADAPVVVGHSMGGFIALHAASRFGERFSGIIAIDTPLEGFPEKEAARFAHALGQLKVYPSEADIVSRFRLIPDQEVLPYLLRFIAETSYRAVEGGWQWKFDPKMFGRPSMPTRVFSELRCRAAVIRGEHGLVPRDMGDTIYELMNGLAPVIEIPAAGHAIMLDQPLALISALRTLLAEWPRSPSNEGGPGE
ncbi:MAG: alpha/beta hydrolase [Pseudonocardiales bacterium]|nr:alpha/beta hydrolase [Pseudonocardiales bacterium]